MPSIKIVFNKKSNKKATKKKKEKKKTSSMDFMKRRLNRMVKTGDPTKPKPSEKRPKKHVYGGYEKIIKKIPSTDKSWNADNARLEALARTGITDLQKKFTKRRIHLMDRWERTIRCLYNAIGTSKLNALVKKFTKWRKQ